LGLLTPKGAGSATGIHYTYSFHAQTRTQLYCLSTYAFLLETVQGVSYSGGQTGEWALVQEEQMGPLLTLGKISLNRKIGIIKIN